MVKFHSVLKWLRGSQATTCLALHRPSIRTCEPRQTLSASFQLAIEVTLEDYCQQKDRTSPRGSGISNSYLYIQSSYRLNLVTRLAWVKIWIDGFTWPQSSNKRLLWIVLINRWPCFEGHVRSKFLEKKHSSFSRRQENFNIFVPLYLNGIVPFPFTVMFLFCMHACTINSWAWFADRSKIKSQLFCLPSRIDSFTRPRSSKVFWDSVLLDFWVCFAIVAWQESKLVIDDHQTHIASQPWSPPNVIAQPEQCSFQLA